jgi:hypothetical protein
VVPVAKFAAGVIDTSDKFSAGVVDTGGASLLANMYLSKFLKKCEMTLMLFLGALRNMIYKKILK